KLGHSGNGIDHPFVHIDVENVRAAFDLLPSHRQGALKIPGQDQFGKLRLASDIRPLTDHGKARVQRVGLEPAQSSHTLSFRDLTGSQTLYHFRQEPDVIRRRTAAAPDTV